MSAAIAERFTATDPRFHLIHSKNMGPSAAKNAGLSRATGRHIYFLGSGDLIQQDALELCVRALDQHTADVVLFEASVFGLDSRQLGLRSRGPIRSI